MLSDVGASEAPPKGLTTLCIADRLKNFYVDDVSDESIDTI